MSELNVFGLREYSRQDLFVDATDAIREADRFYIMTDADVVLKNQEKLIAKKDDEITRLESACRAFATERDANQDAIYELRKEIESLKVSHYAEMVDAGMRERRLRRALYKACANWAILRACLLEYFGNRLHAKKWERMLNKCRAKAEEFR